MRNVAKAVRFRGEDIPYLATLKDAATHRVVHHSRPDCTDIFACECAEACDCEVSPAVRGSSEEVAFMLGMEFAATLIENHLKR
jgi:hypothetical protein